VKKDVSSLRYIALSNWFHEAHLESSNINSQDACNADAPESSGISNPTATSKIPPADQMETLTVESEIPTPPGFQDPEFPDRVYKVKKAMYGLHQAPRAWYSTLSKYLLANGFQRGTIDQTLFIKKHKGEFLLVQVYVDDIIFGSSNPQLCREFEALMHDKFQMSAMGELNFFLGLQVTNISGTKDVASQPVKKDVGISNPTATSKIPPVEQMETLTVESKIPTTIVATSTTEAEYVAAASGYPEFPDRVYKVKKAMYGLLQAPRAWYNTLSKYLLANGFQRVTPKECNLHAVKRIFRYLKGHPKLGLWYPKESPFDLVAYANSDYGGATQDRKLTTGGC
nr:hypothetical protein [Tanacetum cinerariifolium]